MKRDEYQTNHIKDGFDFGGEEIVQTADLFAPPEPTEPELFESALVSSAPAPMAEAKPEALSETEVVDGLVAGPPPSHFGVNLFGDALDPGRSKGKLGDLFLLPPFTILDTRQGYWQERRRAWLAHGIRSEVGRIRDAQKTGKGSVYGGTSDFAEPRGPKSVGGNLLKFSPAMSITRNGDGFDGSKIYAGEMSKEGAEANSTSIFDPVMCELCYRWFAPPGGLVFDPFAGGSVRGLMAGLLGLRYQGVELRIEQVEANREQREQIAPQSDVKWECADARAWLKQYDSDYSNEGFDFILSCPPYADLERYSDEPEDLSTMAYAEFVEAYEDIVGYAVANLRMNRFAAFVVTELREKTKEGFYRGFVAETIHAFEQAGARFYNEAVIVNSIGSLPLRVHKQFTVSRKLGRTHQYLLVFCKGDPRRAAQATPMADLSTNQEEEGEDNGQEQETEG